VTQNILVVDDSDTIRRLTRASLQVHGYEMHEARDAAAAIALAEEHAMDVFVVDFQMPGMNGIDLVRSLRRMPGYEQTPIFVVSSQSQEELVREGKAAGGTAWIVKPFRPTLLAEAVALAIQKGGKGASSPT